MPVPYTGDPWQRFVPWAGRPWALFLDSCASTGGQGRFDILVRGPRITLETRGGETLVRAGGSVARSVADPFALVRHHLAPWTRPLPEVPFCGGAVGYFGYDLARRIERLPETAAAAHPVPDMALGIYDWAVVFDHAEQRAWLAGALPRERLERLRHRLLREWDQTAPREGGFRVRGMLQRSLDTGSYADAFRRVKDYIEAGDCYQVNLACRFSVSAEGDARSAYAVLRRINPAPFSAFLNCPSAQILSSSPERFLRVDGGRVETRPIKGTAPRSDDPAEDGRRAAALARSPKDRAENLMIVDLLRNDLGRTCDVGSIEVPELFRVESFARVHHLISTVRGRLAPGRDALDLLRGCFPGGSVTGAPKVRAMEIIEELERERRGVYCGAIGYVGFDGGMDTSIAIRTLVRTGGGLLFWAGGGIVADSRLGGEVREIGHKAEAMRDLVERFRGDA